MGWTQVAIITRPEQAELLSDALMKAGALSVSIEDAFADTSAEQPIFGEPGEHNERIWENSKVVALLAQDSEPADIIRQAASQLDIPMLAFETETVPEQDWVTLTQAQFTPIRISSRLWITPSWHEIPDAQAINLQLDPGMAFGTGSHPTTRLCLQWLDTHINRGESVLDYGCGSGILAIAAQKLGATRVEGTDIDPQAVHTSQQNAAQNNVQCNFFLPENLPTAQYDVVLANILANPLRMLGDLLASYTRTGGTIVLSGILAEQSDELNTIYETWFVMNEPVFEEGWAILSGTKRAKS